MNFTPDLRGPAVQLRPNGRWERATRRARPDIVRSGHPYVAWGVASKLKPPPLLAAASRRMCLRCDKSQGGPDSGGEKKPANCLGNGKDPGLNSSVRSTTWTQVKPISLSATQLVASILEISCHLRTMVFETCLHRQPVVLLLASSNLQLNFPHHYCSNSWNRGLYHLWGTQKQKIQAPDAHRFNEKCGLGCFNRKNQRSVRSQFMIM